MKKRFTRILAALALLVFMTPSMVGWGQTREITTYQFQFKSNSGNGDSNTSFGNNANVSDVIEEGTSYVQSIPSASKVYPGVSPNGLKFGSSSANGSITFNLSDEGKVLASKIKVNARRYNASKASKVKITINGTTNQEIEITSGELADYEWTLSSQTNINSISLEGLAGTNGDRRIYVKSVTVTYTTSGGSTATSTTTTINASGITNTDVHTSTSAGSLTATVTPEGGSPLQNPAIAWSSSNENVATIDEDGVVTLVAAGTTTITASYAGEAGVYAASSATYELEVTDSTPFSGGDVTFVAGTDMGSTQATGPDSMTKQVVTISSTNAAFGYSDNYRMYKNSVTTVSTSSGVITSIAFTQSGNYSISYLTPDCGTLSDGTWTGSASSIVFTNDGTDQTRATQIVVTVNMSGTPDPVITANNVSIEFGATEGEITYTIANPVDGASLGAVVAEGATITNLTFSTPGAESVSFTCDANNTTTARTATVTLNYVKNGETLATKDVTVTQAADPNAPLTTMDQIFARATEVGSTATEVKITFNNWIVSGASGRRAYVTDGTKGFPIYDSNDGLNFEAGQILTGTKTCSLQLKNGAAQVSGLNVGDFSDITTGEVTVNSMTIAALNPINTGSVVDLGQLTYNGSKFVDDNDNQIEPYKGLFDYGELESGTKYMVKGVFAYYNVKEILPRSAADIVEVVSTEPNTITDGNLSHVSIDELWDGDTFDPIELGDEVTEGTIVYFSLTVEENYTLESVTVLDADNEEVSLTEASESWYFTMPNSSVTINATATQGSVPPVTGDKYVKVTSTTDLTSGQYLIVYEEGAVAFDGSLTTLDATSNTIGVVISNNEIAVNTTTTASEFTIDVTAGTIKSASGYYIGADDYNNMLKTSQDIPYVNSIDIDNEGNALLQMTFTGGTVTLKYNSASNQNRFRYYKSGQKDIQLYKKVESHILTIDGYTDVTEGNNNKGYYLIASPVTVDPATVTGMTSGDFDLYYYDQDASDGLEWRNYEATPFNLVPGKGYLYAKKATTETSTYEFTLTGTPYISEIGTVMGWNLIGNPYATAASLNLPFYRMNSEGSALGTETEGNVNYMEGVFVEITPDPETGDMPVVEFSPVNGKSVAALNLNVSQNRGNVIDNAIIRFDNGRTLSKFQFRKGSTKIYVTEGNKDYAVVRSAAEAEMPVSFRASENGTYTLAIEAENVEMNYLHLIDNLTGMDVDLLQTPSYTFEAKTSDYASRFRLVFKANGTNENNAETFAYFNGTNWTVSNVGDATLQVVDVTGRTVANQMINGNAELNLNQPAGVYVIRLVNGDNVKTQKVVVR